MKEEKYFYQYDPFWHLLKKIKNMKPGDKQQTSRDHYFELSKDGKTITIHSMPKKDEK